MLELLQADDRAKKAGHEQAERQLRGIFEKMPYEIPLLLFCNPAKNELFLKMRN